MNWYKLSQNIQTYKGYKIIGFNPQTKQFYSIFDKSVYHNIKIGTIFSNPKGIYLGTSYQFCMDYYSCGTEDEHKEFILTLDYSSKDIIKGDPTCTNGEIVVSSCKITNIEEINKEEYC